MARSLGDEVRRAVDAELQPGEVFRVVIPVLIPPPNVGGGWGPAVVIVPLFWAVKRSMWRRAAATAQAQVGIPLRRRMLWGTTDRRVLIFAVGARWKVGPLIASIDRSEVIRAVAPSTVSQGWRSVAFELANRPDLRIQVPARLIDPIVNGFGDQAHR